MTRTALALLLGALSLTAPTFANDLPYHQRQRIVVIFSLDAELQATQFDGSKTHVLSPGLYRLDAVQETRGVLTPANYADGSGPFVRYRGGIRGEIRPLMGGAVIRDATVSLKLSDASFAYANIVRAAELELSFRVQLSSMSSTVIRYAGDVARTGPFVPGTLDSVYSAQAGSIEVRHVKLELDDSQLPLRRPLEQFPARIEASVRPTPAYEDGFEIEAGPFDFTLEREALNEVGAVSYDSTTHFPMVEESDYYGDYRSGPYDAELVLQADGNVYLRLAWGLTGRYHGWSYNYVAILTPDEYQAFVRDGALTVSGRATFHYDNEGDRVDIASPMQLELRTTPTPTAAPTAGITAAIPN